MWFPGNAVDVYIYNHDNVQLRSLSEPWQQYDQDYGVSQVFGDYYAATAGQGNDWSDRAYAETAVYYQGYQSASATIQLIAGVLPTVANSVVGSAPAYSWVTADAGAGNYLAPITYAWTVNDSPACGNSSSCSAQLGDEGSYTWFTVTVTDAEGDANSATTNSMAQYSGCPTCYAPRFEPMSYKRGPVPANPPAIRQVAK